jgi:hypothetical protein
MEELEQPDTFEQKKQADKLKARERNFTKDTRSKHNEKDKKGESKYKDLIEPSSKIYQWIKIDKKFQERTFLKRSH